MAYVVNFEMRRGGKGCVGQNPLNLSLQIFASKESCFKLIENMHRLLDNIVQAYYFTDNSV